MSRINQCYIQICNIFYTTAYSRFILIEPETVIVTHNINNVLVTWSRELMRQMSYIIHVDIIFCDSGKAETMGKAIFQILLFLLYFGFVYSIDKFANKSLTR